MSKIPLGPLELGFIAIYLLSLIGIGYWECVLELKIHLRTFI